MANISFKYLVRRLAISFVTIFALANVLFFLLQSMPGSIVNQLISPGMGPEQIQALRERFGLTEPLYIQYVEFVTNYLLFDFGVSSATLEPVSERILRRLVPTLILFLPAFILQYSIGILSGSYLGWKRGTKTDFYGFSIGLVMYSIPFFWLGWILLGIFAFEFELFPSAGMLPAFQTQFNWVNGVGQLVWHLFIPVLSLTLIGWGGPMLVMRTTMQDVTGTDYVRYARAQGYAESDIMTKFAARNALIPVATQAVIGIAFMIDGSVIVETVFSWPGIGDLLVQSVLERDLPTALGAFYVLGVLIVFLRLLTDIVYTILDPRIAFGGTD